MGRAPTADKIKARPLATRLYLEWGKHVHKVWVQDYWGSLVKLESLEG